MHRLQYIIDIIEINLVKGFYLYLFPEYIGKTIYMKVEFNHAGYGRTIPLVYIQNGKLPISYMFKKENGKVVTKNDATYCCG